MPDKSSDNPAYQKPTTIQQAAANPRYQGKIVIESVEGIYSTTSEENAVKKIQQLHKKYPDQPPVSTVIAKGILMPTPYAPTDKKSS
jgi:hypothetical protein